MKQMNVWTEMNERRLESSQKSKQAKQQKPPRRRFRFLAFVQPILLLDYTVWSLENLIEI